MRLFRLVILLAAAAIVVFAAGMALGEEGANATRVLPGTVEKGGTFNVTVTFTGDGDNFSSISLSDHAPTGWNVTTNKGWCQPRATYVKPKGNITSIVWFGPYPNGTDFTVLYQVTVPGCNLSGNYSFSGYKALRFYSDNYYDEYGDPEHVQQNVTGYGGCLYCNVTVVPPAICSTPSIPFYAAFGGQNPQNKTLDVWSSTPCMLNWSLTDDAGWLEAYPRNGSCTDVPNSTAVSANISGMSIGDYTANITIEAPEANNSPRIVPVTLHITDKGILKGQVSFTGRGSSGTRWIEPFVVRFFNTTTKVEMGWSPINVTTDAYGNFTSEDVEVGTYDIGIKNCTCLSMLNTSVAFTVANVTLVDFGETREGDVVENDKVDGYDTSAISAAYNTMENQTGWNVNADLNRNGKVEGYDASMASTNYNQMGDAAGHF